MTFRSRILHGHLGTGSLVSAFLPGFCYKSMKCYLRCDCAQRNLLLSMPRRILAVFEQLTSPSYGSDNESQSRSVHENLFRGTNDCGLVESLPLGLRSIAVDADVGHAKVYTSQAKSARNSLQKLGESWLVDSLDVILDSELTEFSVRLFVLFSAFRFFISRDSKLFQRKVSPSVAEARVRFG